MAFSPAAGPPLPPASPLEGPGGVDIRAVLAANEIVPPEAALLEEHAEIGSTKPHAKRCQQINARPQLLS